MHIAVVGLGVAGATVATLLARQGHRVTVFEQTAAPGPVGAGVLLQPSGQLVLQQLGLLEKVASRAEPIERLVAVTHHGRTLIDLPYRELAPGACAYGVHRGDLFMALFKEMQNAGVELRTGTRPVRCKRTERAAILLDAADAELGAYDYVIACDGARSLLRENSGIPAAVFQYPHGAVWAVGRCDRVRGRLWQVTRGTSRLCGLLPMGGGRCSFFWSLALAERESFAGGGFERFRGDVLALCPDAEPLLAGLRSFEQTCFASYYHVRMRQPFDDRCIFLGDAAHAMSPHLGQGINLALIDAYWFAHVFSRSQDFGAACREYADARRRHLRAYAAITYSLSPFFQSQGTVKGLLRDLFLPLMPHFPPLRRAMVVTMSGMRGGLLGGRLQLPPAHAPARLPAPTA